MPETHPGTHMEKVVKHMEEVRSLLTLAPQKLTQIQLHLKLTKAQTLSIVQRLEEEGEIFCRAGVWRLAEK